MTEELYVIASLALPSVVLERYDSEENDTAQINKGNTLKYIVK